jgi:hypothetical protein
VPSRGSSWTVGDRDVLVAAKEGWSSSWCVAVGRAHPGAYGVACSYEEARDRVKSLSGFDPMEPADRFTLHAAALGAKLLGWPERSHPSATSA